MYCKWYTLNILLSNCHWLIEIKVLFVYDLVSRNLVNSTSLLVDSFRLSTYLIMSTANDSLFSSHPIQS